MEKSRSDKELVSQIKSVNRKISDQALREIYLSNVSIVEQYILKNGGSKEDAADVYQDAVMVFYNMTREGRFEGKSSISTFIYAVSKNIWLKKMRHIVRQQTLSNSEFDRLPLEGTTRKEIDLLSIVKDALAEMGNDCKQLLTFFYFEKLSMNEIMKTFGLGSAQAAKNKKLRCVKKMMQLFKERGITKEKVFG